MLRRIIGDAKMRWIEISAGDLVEVPSWLATPEENASVGIRVPQFTHR